MDKTLSHTRKPAGSIRRLSVAVLVDYLPKSDGKNGVTPTPLSKEELEKVQSLVREAVGFNEQRGDSVSVQNAPFMSEPVAAAEDVPLWQKPEVRDYARQGLGSLVVLVLIFAVLRPVLRSLMSAPLRAAPPPLTVQARDAAAVLAQDRATIGAQTISQPQALSKPAPYDEKLAQARSAVSQDPKRVAQVMKTWIGENA